MDLAAEHPSCQIVLVPWRHDDDHLCPCREAGLQTVLPLLPDAVADGGGVGLLPALDRVIHDQKLRRVACDAGEETSCDHPSAALSYV